MLRGGDTRDFVRGDARVLFIVVMDRRERIVIHRHFTYDVEDFVLIPNPNKIYFL
jgi:hypothetical protein